MGEEEQVLEEHQLTNGEKAVGLTFNPSGDDRVTQAKSLSAALFDLVEQAVPADDGTIATAIKRKLRDSALAAIISAQMWAVKVLTWKD